MNFPIDAPQPKAYRKAMKVSAQYAEAQFPDLYRAAQNGEEIEIERPGKPNLILVPKPEHESAVATLPVLANTPRIPLRELLGIGHGLVRVPDEEEWVAIKRANLADMPDFSPLTSESL